MNSSLKNASRLVAALVSLGVVACGSAPEGAQPTEKSAATQSETRELSMEQLRDVATKLVAEMKENPAVKADFEAHPLQVLGERGVSPEQQEDLYHEIIPDADCKITCLNSCRKTCAGSCTYSYG